MRASAWRLFCDDGASVHECLCNDKPIGTGGTPFPIEEIRVRLQNGPDLDLHGSVNGSKKATISLHFGPLVESILLCLELNKDILT